MWGIVGTNVELEVGHKVRGKMGGGKVYTSGVRTTLRVCWSWLHNNLGGLMRFDTMQFYVVY